MRHNKKFNHLSRKANHRAAMLSNMACSLIMHKRISTTLAKAKALRIYVEPILTRAKEDNMNNRRLAFSLLKQKEVVTELFQNVIELVDYNENMLKETKKAAKKATRRAGKKAVKEAVEEVEEAPAAEAPAAE